MKVNNYLLKVQFTRMGNFIIIDLIMKYYSIDEIEKIILEYPGFRKAGAFIVFEDRSAGIAGNFSWITRGTEVYNINVKTTPRFLNEEKMYVLDYTVTLPLEGDCIFTDIKIIRMYCEFILEEAQNLKIALKRMSLEGDFDSK